MRAALFALAAVAAFLALAVLADWIQPRPREQVAVEARATGSATPTPIAANVGALESPPPPAVPVPRRSGELGGPAPAGALEPPPAPRSSGDTLTPLAAGYHGPGLSRRQVFGLALYVSDDPAWAEWAAETFAGCEARLGELAYVGAVGENADGSLDVGLPQANEVHGAAVDLERVRRDPVYALVWAYREYQVNGARPWACAREANP